MSRSSDPFHIVCYYIKWVTTSWTDSITDFCLFQITFRHFVSLRQTSLINRHLVDYSSQFLFFLALSHVTLIKYDALSLFVTEQFALVLVQIQKYILEKMYL